MTDPSTLINFDGCLGRAWWVVDKVSACLARSAACAPADATAAAQRRCGPVLRGHGVGERLTQAQESHEVMPGRSPRFGLRGTRRAISEIDRCSPRRCRRISAQSSTSNTRFLPARFRARLSAKLVNFRGCRALFSCRLPLTALPEDVDRDEVETSDGSCKCGGPRTSAKEAGHHASRLRTRQL